MELRVCLGQTDGLRDARKYGFQYGCTPHPLSGNGTRIFSKRYSLHLWACDAGRWACDRRFDVEDTNRKLGGAVCGCSFRTQLPVTSAREATLDED